MKKGFTIFILLLVIIAGSYYGYTKYTEHKNIELMQEALSSNEIYDGIRIDGVDVSGLSKQEAKEKVLNKIQEEIEGKSIIINAEENEYNLELKNLEQKFDIDKAIDEAYNYAREGELVERYNDLQAIKDKGLDISLEKNFEYSYLDKFVSDIAKDIDRDAVNAEFSVNNGKITSTESQEGKKLDAEKLKSDIIGAIESHQESVIASVETIKPEKSHSELEKINGLIGQFSTDISSSSNDRKTNIRISSNAISKKLLLPGESLDFNKTVGKVSTDKGYKNAHVLKDGAYEDGLGGGMCQTSTTLYNALVRAGVKILERHPHSRAANYVPKGQDGAVWYGLKNLRFENSYDFPIYIDSSVTKNKLTFYVYGNTNEKDYDISLSSEIVEVVKSETIEKEDPNLKPGERVVDVQGYDGYRVITNKIVTKNGKVISNKQFTKDYYPKRDTIVRVSSKDKEEAPSEPNESKQDNNNEAVILPWWT